MKNALVALDSTFCSGTNFERLCEGIDLFQKAGIIPTASIVSIYHASLTPLPLEYYPENKSRFMKEALHSVRQAAEGRFAFDSARVLHANSSNAEEHVELLSKYGQKMGASLLVVGSSDRAGLPYWFLGSFSETAALRASLPVLVIKPYVPALSFSKQPKFVLAVDVAVPPQKKMVDWIAEMAKSSKATLELVYIVPKQRIFFDALQVRKRRSEATDSLQALQSRFSRAGIRSRFSIIEEQKSVAHTLAQFAEENRAWLTITTAADRPRVRKILLGSRARHVLALTKRPFLCLRLD